MIERSDAMKIMDELEAQMMKKGWPIPLTPFYLVDHERVVMLLDQLRVCLQDEMDSRFIKAFSNASEAEKVLYQKKPKNQGKERSH
jgi:hypothetical protein